MDKKTVVNEAVAGVVGQTDLMSEFDLMVDAVMGDITKSVGLTFDVEKAVSDIERLESGIASCLWSALISQCDSVLAGEVYQGEPITFTWSEVVRQKWCDTYLATGGFPADSNAAIMAWSRNYKVLNKLYGYVKPTADTKESEKKAKQRAKEKELLAAYNDVSIDELKEQAKHIADDAVEDKAVKKELDKLVKVINAKKKAVEAENKDTIKELKDSIKAKLKDCIDVFVLENVLMAFSSDTEDMFD